ncbi:MAG: ABC transporter permease subunit [Campylobacteraceae bacterium]|jgi:NitT/TauT family transport system permease protein|nr:ABC transporter permease subunit [Campylobacteraceae bacterium]
MAKNKRIDSIGDLKNRYEKELKSNYAQEIKIELSLFERVFNIGVVRKAFIIIILALVWQFYAVYLDNDLMFPTFLATLKGFWSVISNGELAEKTITSLKVLFTAYICGILAAGTLTVLAITTRIGTDILEVLTSMFNPLPAIALLPLALLWFGLGYPSIIFVIIHAVTWPIALNIYNGFMGVSNTLRMVGKNYELTGLSFVFKILIPAAFASILTGLKVGWAFSWRTLIAAELVFGVSSGGGGLGWFIYEKKNQLDIDLVFAGLLTVIIIGILVENIIFKTIERKTVVKWGMKF